MTERTTVRLPDDLVRRAKTRAGKQGRTLTALIEEGLRRVLDERAGSVDPRQAPLPVSSASGGLAPGLGWDDLRVLEAGDYFDPTPS